MKAGPTKRIVAVLGSFRPTQSTINGQGTELGIKRFRFELECGHIVIRKEVRVTEPAGNGLGYKVTHGTGKAPAWVGDFLRCEVCREEAVAKEKQ